jgi:hypothetical protein
MEKIEMEAEGSATEYDPRFQMTLCPHQSGYTNANERRVSCFLAAGATSFICTLGTKSENQ